MLSSLPPGVSRSAPRRAFSLIEVLVAVTLMSVIVIGLLAMFSQTQRAFRAGITQVDVMEGGRAACELMARELEQATPTGLQNTLNLFAQWNGYSLIQSLPGTTPAPVNDVQWRTNILDDVFFFARENRNWQGIGYRVESPNLVGTLYRYESNVVNLNLDGVRQADDVTSPVKFRDRVYSTRASRIIDGVVHLRLLAYDDRGRLIIQNSGSAIGVTNRILRGNIDLPPDLNLEYHFRSNAVPAYLELELGLLEAKTAERCRTLALQSQAKFLEKKSGNVQIFRQRITVRNVDPIVYQ